MQPIKRHIAPYTVEIHAEYKYEDLQSLWLDIERNSDVPFFLTWNWISCWITTYRPKFILVKASIGAKAVTAGLFTISQQKRKGLINSMQIRLHQMGDPLLDQIWMEYNDFICLPGGHREYAVNACLKALDEEPYWDEIVLSMMTAPRALQVIKTNHLASLDMYRPCYAVNLKDIRKQGMNYLDTLTANTRYQIRRSQRLYEKKYGPLRLITASSTEEALEFFHQSAPYHIERWTDSGFKNPKFVEFHENLIKTSFSHGNVHLFKVLAGKEVIAIIYYHCVGRKIYFYLHGLEYGSNRKLKPGLVSHAIATQHFLDQGMEIYDYMGGYSQYKEQLAQISEQLVTVIIQRPRSRFKIENLARNIKNRYFP